MSITKKLFTGSLVILIGTLIGSFGSYLFNMLVGRFLGPDQYGDFTTLMSLSAILTVGSGAIMTIAMKYAGEYYALKDYDSLKKFFFSFTKYAAYLGLAIIILGIILTKPIGHFFAIDNRLSLYIIFFSMALGIVTLIGRGYLQGLQKFNNVAITGIIETGCRIVLGIGLILLGYKIAGAMVGVALATIIAYLYMLLPISKVFRDHAASKTKKHIKLNRKEIFHYSWPTLITTALLAISLNVDILAVKHYFSATDAGNYAAISTIGKIIFYLTAPIITVMFPLITERRVKGYKHYRIFLLSFLMVLVGSLIVLGAYYVMPGTVIRILYGPKYTQYFNILPEVGFIYFLFSIVNLVINYFMAIKKFAFIPIFFVVIIAQVISLVYFHQNFNEIIKILIGTYGLLSSLLLLYYFLLKKKQISQLFKGEYQN